MAASDSYLQDLCVDAAIASPERSGRISHAHLLKIYSACTSLADWIACSGAILLVELLHAHATAMHGSALHAAFALSAIGGTLTTILLSEKEPCGACEISPRIRETESVLCGSATSLLFLWFVDVTLGLHVLGASSLIALALIPTLVAVERQAAISIKQKYCSSMRVGRVAWAQRSMDIAVSGCLLCLFAPLFLIIAIAVRLDSPGPSFFVQERVGQDGRLFRIFKFRSMFVTAARYEVSPARSNDPRITPVGRILRRLSLDELPQLMNVMVGDMALVGPRPEMPFLVERHRALHLQRLKAKPGITGLWQLSADRPRPIHENVHHDLYYIENGNLFLDLAILVHTLFRAARGGV